MNSTEIELAAKAAELKGANRALNIATTPGLHDAEAVQAGIRSAARIIADELDELIMSTLRTHRAGSRAYEAAAELARADSTGKGARISAAVGGSQ